MGVSNPKNRKDRTADGVLTSFDFDFGIYQASDLAVYEVTVDEDGKTVSAVKKTLGSDYTVELSESVEGGTVNTNYTPADGKIIRMVGEIPATQDVEFPPGSGFSEPRIRKIADKLTRLVAQALDKVSLCIVRPEYSGEADVFTLTQLNAAVASAQADAASALVSKNAAAASAVAAAASAASVPTMATILAAVFPIGSVYSNGSVTTNPATIFGFGTWVPYAAGKTVFGLDAGGDADFDALADTGGSKTKNLAHTHTGTTDPNTDGGNCDGSSTPFANKAHTHTFTTGSGGSASQDVLNPYVVAAMWKRTA